jgi:hypothetical protein
MYIYIYFHTTFHTLAVAVKLVFQLLRANATDFFGISRMEEHFLLKGLLIFNNNIWRIFPFCLIPLQKFKGSRRAGTGYGLLPPLAPVPLSTLAVITDACNRVTCIPLYCHGACDLC